MEGLGAQDPGWIGGYRLLGRLGEGGMGRVYLARSERGRTVAVKAVKAELARQPDFRRRFTLEIAAARRVGEAWTAPVLDADTEAPEPWVATGYIAGPALSQVVDDDYGPLPEQSVLALATGLVKALESIHTAGLIHRDLKPSNILLTFDGPRVIDFGIARAVDAAMQSSGGLTSAGAIIGSPGFMSPEQVRGETVTAACDVFCLGAVLAYAATGRMPFGSADSGIHALMFRIAEEEPDLFGINGPLLGLVSACLAKDPAARPSLKDLAARTGGEISGTWLPGEVLAQLGRHAVRLLDSEDPQTAAAVRDAVVDAPETAGAPGTPNETPPPFATPGTPNETPPPFATPAPAPFVTGSPPPAYQNGMGGPVHTSGPYGYPQPAWPSSPATPQHTGYQPAPPYQHGPPAGTGTGPLRPAGGTAPGPPRSPRGLATATWMLLAAVAVWTAIFAMWSMIAYSTLGSGTESLAPETAPGYESLKASTHVLEAFGVLTQLPAIVLWLMWFWRLRMNAEAFRPGSQRYGPGMAVGVWFIPVGSLFMPKQVVNDIWSACAPAQSTATGGPWQGGGRPSSRPALLNGWWTMWIISMVFSSLLTWDSWYEADTVNSAQGWLVLNVMSGMVTVAAAILAIQVVLRLTRLQDSLIGARPRG